MIWYQDCLWVNTLIFVSLSLFSVEQVELQETDPWSMTGWSWGSADPSPSFFSLFSPVLHSISTNPLPSPRCPFLPPVTPLHLTHRSLPPIPTDLNQPCPMYSPEQENISTTASTKVPVKYGELIVLG